MYRVQQKKRITFNIRGEIFQTFQSTLRRLPNTLLGKLNKQSELYCNRTGQYLINRSRQCFGAILYFYQTDILSCPSDIPIQTFIDECKHYQLPKSVIQDTKVKGGILKELDEDDDDDDKHAQPPDDTVRSRAWDLLENPETSRAARLFAIFSLLVILLSIFTACLETVKVLDVDPDTWSKMELATNCWFLLELLLRFTTCPNTRKFVTDFSNIIDGVVVIPYFMLILLANGRVQSLGFLRCFRFIRVLRLFRLSKHNRRIHIIQAVLKSCVGDFQMLLVCVVIETSLIGSIMYYMESKDNPQFSSIPQSLWWCIVTLTSVGYGDVTPISWYGKVFTAAVMVFGAVTMTLPICSVVNTFGKVYYANTEHNQFIG